MVTGYSEDALVEQPAIALLGELGWETVNAYPEFDHGPSALGRETTGEVILTQRLRPALARLNPELPPAALDEAVAELQRDRSRMSLVAANLEIYHALKNGVRVTVPDPEGELVALVRVIDWNTSENNDFLLCYQFWVAGEMHTRQLDLVGFVKGLPLLIVELKAAYREEHWTDLTNVEFEALAAKFKIRRQRTMNEQLKGSVAQKVMAMVRKYRTHMDFLEHFHAMFEAYNAGSLNAENFFQQLPAFAQNLNEEDARRVGKQLNEEELTLFELLTRPDVEMGDEDRDSLKTIVREMLATLKAGKLVLDRRKRQQASAEAWVSIDAYLDQKLPVPIRRNCSRSRPRQSSNMCMMRIFGVPERVLVAVKMTGKVWGSSSGAPGVYLTFRATPERKIHGLASLHIQS